MARDDRFEQAPAGGGRDGAHQRARRRWNTQHRSTSATPTCATTSCSRRGSSAWGSRRVASSSAPSPSTAASTTSSASDRAGGVAASPFDPERWILEQQQRQRELLDTLRRLQTESAGNDQMQAALHTRRTRAALAQRVLPRLPAPADPVITAPSRRGSTTRRRRPRRQAAAATLGGWEADLRALAAEPVR